MKFVKKLGLGIINLAIIAAVAWYAYQTFDEYINNPWTRNGQVRGHVIQVSPRVTGMVTGIAVIDNQFVHEGDLLFEIDPEFFEIAIAQAEANLKRARISSKSSKIEYDRLQEIFEKDPG
ncbi:MAG: efflux transporter periplasmic adaptor subunit, partial [Gammaproteobacteria bacterium]